MPSLCSIEWARASLRAPSEPSGSTRNFGTRKSDTPREHQMDDIVGEVVLAVGDEDLLPADAVAAVGGALGLGAQRAHVGAGLRLGELHRAHPFAGDELGQIDAFERVAAVMYERFDARHGQQ